MIAWPGVKDLDVGAFADFVVRVSVEEDNLTRRSEDVFLAAACAIGDPVALACFDRHYVGAVPRHVSRFGLTATQIRDLEQSLRIRLLAGPDARIGRYNGIAPLDAWVRVIVVRMALDEIDREQRESPKRGSTEALEGLVASGDPEGALDRATIGPPLKDALMQGLEQLDDRDRILLRMHFVDGLSVDEIGRVNRVHRATVARWLVAIRGRVYATVQRSLNLRRRPHDSEFSSIVQGLGHEVDLSLERVLGLPAQ